jgi:hypothetical protein
VLRRLAIAALSVCVGLLGFPLLGSQSQTENAVHVLSNTEARKLAARRVEAAVPSGSAPSEFTVRVSVGEDGKVRDVTNPNQLPPELFSAAATAAREWWFRDYPREGKPEGFQADITFHGPIVGIAATKDGKPVAGVYVYGSQWTCCPPQQDTATTDENGGFRLERPGAIIHFSSDDFQPLSLIVRPDISTLHVTLEPPSNSLSVPACGKPSKDTERVGGGRYGLQFDVPLRDAKLIRGEWDVDYVVHIVKPNKGHDQLELWFGPYAMDSQPYDDQFIDSTRFAQRSVVASPAATGSGRGGVVGLDSWGALGDGTMWRQVSVVTEGARYKNARPENAALFDRVINSLCFIPLPSR